MNELNKITNELSIPIGRIASKPFKPKHHPRSSKKNPYKVNTVIFINL